MPVPGPSPRRSNVTGAAEVAADPVAPVGSAAQRQRLESQTKAAMHNASHERKPIERDAVAAGLEGEIERICS